MKIMQLIAVSFLALGCARGVDVVQEKYPEAQPDEEPPRRSAHQRGPVHPGETPSAHAAQPITGASSSIPLEAMSTLATRGADAEAGIRVANVFEALAATLRGGSTRIGRLARQRSSSGLRCAWGMRAT